MGKEATIKLYHKVFDLESGNWSNSGFVFNLIKPDYMLLDVANTFVANTYGNPSHDFNLTDLTKSNFYKLVKHALTLTVTPHFIIDTTSECQDLTDTNTNHWLRVNYIKMVEDVCAYFNLNMRQFLFVVSDLNYNIQIEKYTRSQAYTPKFAFYNPWFAEPLRGKTPIAESELYRQYEKRVNAWNAKKTFLCLNRIGKNHRYYFMYQLHKHNLLNNAIASLEVGPNPPNIGLAHGILKRYEYDDANIQYFLATLPIVADAREVEDMQVHATLPENFWSETLFSIIHESNIGSARTTDLDVADNEVHFLTEKTSNAILNMHPFIVFANNGINNKLREIGFKTYNEIFDREYDYLPYTLKATRVLRIIDSIVKMQPEQAKAKFLQLAPKIVHNYKFLFEYANNIMPNNLKQEIRLFVK